MTGEAITFNLPTRRLVFGMTDCPSCGYRVEDGVPAGRHVVFGTKPCVKCNGTGRRGNGRCRECKQFSEKHRLNTLPVGQVPDYANPSDGGPCERCKGTATVPAGTTDHLPADTIAAILAVCPVRVYVRSGDLSWGESYLGMTGDARLPHPLWSTTDYGDGAKRYLADAEAFISEVTDKIRADSSTQACKLADEAGLVVDHIAILLAGNGYTVVGVPGVVAEQITRATENVDV